MRHRERGTRNSQPGQDPSGPDQVLDALLAGGPLPGEDQGGLQPVADVLAALRSPAAAAELTGQASALAEFRARPRRAARTPRPRRRRGPVLGTLLRPRPAMVFAAGAVVVAGLAAGAYEGDLPGPVQQWAHHTFGLTAARSTASPAPSHSRPGSHPSPTPALSPDHHHGPARRGHPEHGEQRHGASHRPAGRDGRRPARPSGSPGTSPASGPSGAPSPSGQATPSPSTTPAAQPSAQSSTAPGPGRSHQPGSGAPSSPP